MSAKKSRFNGLDTAAMVSHTKRTMLGYKLANVYDGNVLGVIGSSSSGGGGVGEGAKGVYMFKLADPSGGGSGAAAVNAPENNAAAVPSPIQDDGNNDKRSMLLLESGVRFHPTTHYTQSTTGSSSSHQPSPFAMKLRKHLKNLRLENITQLGNMDRVVDFRFGSGTYTHHVILELYAQGNIILCDVEYRILALLRTHQYEVMTTTTLPHAVAVGIVDNDGEGMEEKKITSSDEVVHGEKKEEVKVRVGTIYPVTFATTLAVVGVNDESCSSRTTSGLLSMNASEAYNWAKSELTLVQNRASVFAVAEESNLKGNKVGGGSKKKKKSMDDSLVLKAFLLKPNSGVYHYGPSLIEHCIATAGVDPLMKLTVDNMESMLPVELWTTLLTALQCEGNKIIDNLTLNDSGGYILYKSKATTDDKNEKNDSAEKTSSLLPAMMTNQNPHSDKTLLEFQPHLLQQHKDQQYLQYTTFTAAVDEFFSHLSSQRMLAKADAAEATAHDRLAKIKVDQQRRIDGLVREQEEWMDSARLVETHATDIDRALGVINSALDSGIDWDSLDQLVLLEQGNSNPIALLIHKLLLDKDQVVLALPDVENWDESSNPDSLPPIQLVTISIKESAHGNARAMFSHYRSSKEKGIKTVENTSTALKAAEAKARQQLAEAQKKKLHVQIAPQRRTYWFEKFAWFITSDNYLVVAGRDAQQNEQLVKRYLRPGDVYLHAEVHGAATCILRAKRQRRPKDGKTQVMPLSDQALREAGHFTICRSAAWTSKMVTSAYWVESHQVSKTAPTGEYLTVGSFMIRGRKNFLPPSTLEMGLGVLFRLGDDASIARHANERRDFALIEQDQMFEQQDVEELDSGITEKDIEKLTINVDDDVDNDDEDKNDVEEEDHDDNDNNEQGLEEENDTSLEHENVISPSTDALKSYESVIPKASSIDDRENHVSFQEEPRPLPSQDTKKKENELSRGKRSKLKRAKKRYNEQDDEDRELVMLALHGRESSKKDKKGKKGSKIIASENATQLKVAEQTMALLVRDSQKVAETLDDNVQQILAKCVTVHDNATDSDTVRWSKFDAEVLEQLCEMATLDEQLSAANRLLELSNATRIDNYSASLSGIIRTIKKHGVALQDLNVVKQLGDGKHRKSKYEKQVEKEAWKEILAEDGIVENDGDEEDRGDVDDTAELRKLTGKPTAQDSVFWAIPVCAPYSVLSKYTYRVKLTPGSVKRGKASKQSVDMFLRGEAGTKTQLDEGTKRDLALIKVVNDSEWIQTMIGDVRIASAGASKVAAKQKSKGKAKK